MTEQARFGRAAYVPRHRAWRAARLGGLAVNVASSMAAQRIQGALRGEHVTTRDLLMTPANIGRITDELARMRGAAMKLGQLLSMDAGDVLPPELSQILARLRAEADFMPPSQLKKVLTKAWGTGWLQHFEKFEVRPVAAASIGQVHRAKLKDGRDVAIKVQYPGVASSIDSDVANVATLAKISGLVPHDFEIDPYVEEARRQLHEETDYLKEAASLRRFQMFLEESDRYELPEVFEDLTTSSVLAMSFIESQPLETISELDQNTRNMITEDLIDLVLQELFEFGVVQSDPNFANFRYNKVSQRLVLLDFGATREVSSTLAATYRKLILAGLDGDTETLTAAAAELGIWDSTTAAHYKERLTRMLEMVFSAIRGHQSYDFADPTLTQQMNAEGIALAESGFVPPPLPIDVLFVQRKLAGIYLIASHLKARLPLERIIRSRLGQG